jgi:hypothetical protein
MSRAERDENRRRPADVIVSRRGVERCFADECPSPAPFTVWADVTNEDGEHDDCDPLTACAEHLADACAAKLDSQE